jgi:NitT/TauT family transport system ATP-binding protein
MTEEDAARTSHTVTNWARYAEYFAYDEQTDMFSLENPS